LESSYEKNAKVKEKRTLPRLSIMFYFEIAGNGGISHLRQINVLGQDILTSHINPRFHATKHCFGAREFHKKDNLA
jgi:hypothetical protein